jgi:hypothetical protein
LGVLHLQALPQRSATAATPVPVAALDTRLPWPTLPPPQKILTLNKIKIKDKYTSFDYFWLSAC